MGTRFIDDDNFKNKASSVRDFYYDVEPYRVDFDASIYDHKPYFQKSWMVTD